MPVTSRQKAPKPTEIVPYDKENKYISKADFIEKNTHRMEKNKKLKKLADKMDREFEEGKKLKKDTPEPEKEVTTVKKP